MPAKKMRVEVLDEDGNRYAITFHGRVTRKKALRLLDIVELLGGVHEKQESQVSLAGVSKFDKTKSTIQKHFPLLWFSSKEVLTVYEQEFNEPMALSTISTYLARMTDRGFLMRRGPTYNRKYRMMAELAQSPLRVMKDK